MIIDNMLNELNMLIEMWNFLYTHNINAMSKDEINQELDKIKQKYNIERLNTVDVRAKDGSLKYTYIDK